MTTDSAILYRMREASGLPLSTCMGAARHAEEVLGGDLVLALIHAELAIARSGTPIDHERLAADALALRPAYAARPGWAALDAASIPSTTEDA